MIHQLRIYEIFEDTKSAFHDRFRDHAARLMRQHGFDIRAMWEARTDTRTEFVYLLAWPDEATLRARWSTFMADEEWSRIKRETGAAGGPLVGEIEDRVLVPVAYSPAMSTSRSGRAS
jgi:heme-degrading monooxygenase HmoA